MNSCISVNKKNKIIHIYQIKYKFLTNVRVCIVVDLIKKVINETYA
jgi:hypothetical protein